MEAKDEVCVAWGTGIAGYVADSGEPVNIPDAYADARFNDAIDSRTGYRTQALLCMPIKDSAGEVLGVAQVINKLNGDRFTDTDEKVFASYLQFCGIGLRNAQLYEQSQLEIKRNQVLLDLARMIFEEQSTIEHMVLRILTHMQSLIQCQRVQVSAGATAAQSLPGVTVGDLLTVVCMRPHRFCSCTRHRRVASRACSTSRQTICAKTTA